MEQAQEAARRLKGARLFSYDARAAAIMLVPIAAAVYYGFFKWSGFGARQWFGIGNYRRALADPVFLHAIGHNVESGPTGVKMAFENIERALRGDLPESVINPEVIPAWRRRLAMLR